MSQKQKYGKFPKKKNLHNDDNDEEINHKTSSLSYELFDLSDSNFAQRKKKKLKNSNSSSLKNKEIIEIEDDESDSAMLCKEEYTINGQTVDDVQNGDSITDNKHVNAMSSTFQKETETKESKPAASASNWLSTFLTKKKSVDVPEPPEIIPSNDMFLREYSQDYFTHHPFSKDETVKKRFEDIDNNENENEIIELLNEPDDYATPPRQDDTQYAIDELQPPDKVSLQLANLPYKVSVEEIKEFGSQFGYSFKNVKMGVNKKKQLPSGSATLELFIPSGLNAYEVIEYIHKCVKKLQGEEILGRAIRVFRQDASEGRRSSHSGSKDSRYFVVDIGFKCNSCGKVGHKANDCSNPPIPTPCHLCAGDDHDAGLCPNITCYRCGTFGHHSKDCTRPQLSRPVVCTHCGSKTHDIRQCLETGRGYVSLRVENRSIRCMSCNGLGHAMCQSVPNCVDSQSNKRNRIADVYCPNCGERGHHIDFPSSYEHSSCVTPRYDAYFKLPELLRENGLSSPKARDAYYRELIKAYRNIDMNLFPSLINRRPSLESSSSSAAVSSASQRGSERYDRYDDRERRPHNDRSSSPPPNGNHYKTTSKYNGRDSHGRESNNGRVVHVDAHASSTGRQYHPFPTLSTPRQSSFSFQKMHDYEPLNQPFRREMNGNGQSSKEFRNQSSRPFIIPPMGNNDRYTARKFISEADTIHMNMKEQRKRRFS